MKENKRVRQRETDIYYKDMRQLTDTKENLKNQASESSGTRAASGSGRQELVSVTSSEHLGQDESASIIVSPCVP